MGNEQVAPRGGAMIRVALALLTVAVLTAAPAAMAQEPHAFAPGGSTVAVGGAGTWAPTDLVPVYDGGSDGTTSYIPPVAATGDRALPKLSDIQVTYSGFGPNSRAAFEYAVTIWERMIRSNVPIKVKATWKALPAGQLGSASSNGQLRDFAGAPRAGTYYSMALADARAGRDLAPGQPDIVANFNSAASWNTDPNAITQVGRMDLVTVALHEIGHGLGMTSSFRVANGVGTFGYGENRPTAWDRYLADGSGASLLAGNGTSGLAAKLQSNAVRFTGSQAVGANGGTVRVYSPSPYDTARA